MVFRFEKGPDRRQIPTRLQLTAVRG
eukprot:COSAG01_NODE_74638_length_206_cov_10.719626_1_plen_25_part_01